MKLTILGSSPAIPNPGNASSGYLIESGINRLLIDCGHAVTSILQTVCDLRDLTGVVISHMHPDHIFDLVPLKYGFLFGGLDPIPLFLPPRGEAALRRLQDALDLSDRFFRETFEVAEYDPDAGSLQIPDLSIRFAPTQHFIPGYAMRFSAAASPESDVFYSSDTGWEPELVEIANESSLALVEATLVRHEDSPAVHGHMTGAEAGRLGRQAHVRRLVLTHYWHTMSRELREEAEKTFGSQVEMATSGAAFCT